MAGKRGRPSKAKAAEQPAAAAVDHDDDNKLDNDSSIKVRRIVRSRRDLDQKVQRAIELHFGHFPRFLVENKIVAGRSLRDRILNDMEEIEGTANRPGSAQGIGSTSGLSMVQAWTPVRTSSSRTRTRSSATPSSAP